jgi:hypothetical protein
MSSGSCWSVALLLGMLGTGCGLGGLNNTPVVTEGPELSLKDVTPGTEVQTHLVVTDEDGDTLHYQWLQTPEEPAGTFSDTFAQEPSWVAPEVTQSTTFTLKVRIRDGGRGLLVGLTTIQVHPRQ